MAKRIEIIGEYLVVTDTITSEIEIDAPKSLCSFTNNYLKDGNILFDFLDKNNVANEIIIPLSDAVDGADTPFTESTFRDFARVNLGFKSPQGGGGDTPENIKLKYESNPNTNAYTDAAQSIVDNQPTVNSDLQSQIDALGSANVNRWVVDVDNSSILNESSNTEMTFQSYVQTVNIGSLATFDGTDLTVTATSKDIEVTSVIYTIGDMELSQKWYYRDNSDTISTRLGEGSLLDAVSTIGVFGKGSYNNEAKAVVKAGTTVTLNLVQRSSFYNQKIKTGSFINVKEL